jgi:dolichol-phosphate mannosyltransferase
VVVLQSKMAVTDAISQENDLICPPEPTSIEAYRTVIDLAVIIPTFNECDNIPEVIARLDRALQGLAWEAIFVDDNSRDGTGQIVLNYARKDRRIRLLERIGRRGLSSACIEGILASSADWIAVMDADMQHDESILSHMLACAQQQSLDLVVGTRNADHGSMGDFSPKRLMLSRLGEKVSRIVCQCEVSDPMSGFFIASRSFVLECVPHMEKGGFKILVDLFTSSRRPVQFAEVGYTFRERKHGHSKLDANTAIEFLALIINKFTKNILPPRFIVFALVGSIGVITHLTLLALLHIHWRESFFRSQIIATYVAMAENFFLNNSITYRDRSLRGLRLFFGLVTFGIACSFGAWASVVFARALVQSGIPWYAAGVGGIILSSVWNYSITSLFTWQVSEC